MIKTYKTHANALRALAQFKRNARKVTLFTHYRNDKRFKNQLVSAIFIHK